MFLSSLVFCCVGRKIVADADATDRWMPQVDEERKEAEAIKDRVAKDEAAVATRQEEVLCLCPGTTTPSLTSTIVPNECEETRRIHTLLASDIPAS